MFCTDDYEQSTSDSVTTTYRLQDITDVHIMARLQEASEYIRVSLMMIQSTLHTKWRLQWLWCIFLRSKAGLCLHTCCRRLAFTERPWGETNASISLQHCCWKYRWLHSRKSNWGVLFLLLAAWPVVTDLFLLSAADIRSQAWLPDSKAGQTSPASHPVQAA